jgi:hypothetical protein
VKKKVLQINSNTRSVKIEFFPGLGEREREEKGDGVGWMGGRGIYTHRERRRKR